MEMRKRKSGARIEFSKWSQLLLLVPFGLLACGPAPEQSTTQKVEPAKSQTELKATFDAATAVLMDIRTAAQLSKITPRWQAKLTTSDDGLKVTALTADPQLLLPPLAVGKPFVIQIKIDSPVDTLLEVFFNLRGQDNYPGNQFQRCPVKAGKNEVYFMIDQPELVDPLRLDPGIAAGEYLIRSIVAKEVSKTTN
jgi:hypothetical protein